MATPLYIRELAAAAALSGSHSGIVDQGGDAKRVTLTLLKAFYLATLAAADITDASANGRSLITSANYAAMRSLLSVYSQAQADAAFQPIDSDLTAIAALSTGSFGRGVLELLSAGALLTYAGLSANGASLVIAANYSAMRTLLSVYSQVQVDAAFALIAGQVFTGPIQTPNGTVSAPGIQVGDTDTGFYRTALKLNGALDGVEFLRASTIGLALGAGFDPSEALHVRRTGGAARILIDSEGATELDVARYSSDALAAGLKFLKYRGTISSPTVISANDSVLAITAYGYDGAALRLPFVFNVDVIAPTPSATDMEARAELFLAPSGSVTPTSIMTLRHAQGLLLFNNQVINQNRHFCLRSYTIGTLPSASTAGQQIYCSDLGGGGAQLNSDGTNWRRVSRGGQQDILVDANFTLTPLTSAEEQFHWGTLTADRAMTISTTNAYVGARFRLTRAGGGAFNITHALKNLATNTWAEFIYGNPGPAWYLASYGAL